MPVDPVRDAAIDVLLRVFERGAFLNLSLDKTLRRKTDLSERGARFLTQLVYGTTRHAGLCDYIVQPLLHQPLDELPTPIRMIMRMGAFQALFCRQVTFPAMVHTSVDLAKKRGHIGTSRLVNAVLKRIPQSIEQIVFPDHDTQPVEFLSARYSIVPWIVTAWIDEYGFAGAETLCVAADTEAPRTLRVNTLRTDRATVLQVLEKAGLSAEADPVVPEAITLNDGHLSTRSKIFQHGDIYIQDTSSMLPPHLLEPQAGESILDLCAAPGGKTTHLAQLTGDAAQIVALDLPFRKLGLVQENAARLQLDSIRCVAGDGLCAPFPAGSFDRVLVDAPCTGLGTLRRHPELKQRVRPEDPARLALEQIALLRSALGLCKNGGLIVYSVCTVTREETERVIGAILDDGGVVPEDGPEWFNQWKIETGRYRILPNTAQWDGYFLTRLRKRS